METGERRAAGAWAIGRLCTLTAFKNWRYFLRANTQCKRRAEASVNLSAYGKVRRQREVQLRTRMPTLREAPLDLEH